MPEKISTLSYDEDEEKLNLQRVSMMMRTNFGLGEEYEIYFQKITNIEASKELDLFASLDSMNKEQRAQIEALLLNESALFYRHVFNPDSKKGLPHSVIYIPKPSSANPDDEMGYIIFNISSPSTTFIDRSDFETMIASEESFLLVIRSPCSSYMKLQLSGILDHIEHYNIDYDNDYFYWTAMIDTHDITFPIIAYFENGKSVDVHQGYNDVSRLGSIRTFLYRNNLISIGKKYHTIIDDNYVKERFRSYELFYRWMTINKDDLSGIHFKNLNLDELILFKCSLNGSKLENVSLKRTDMRFCDLRNTEFINTDWKMSRHDNIIM